MQIIFHDSSHSHVAEKNEKFNSKHLRFAPKGLKRTPSSLLEIPKINASRTKMRKKNKNLSLARKNE